MLRTTFLVIFIIVWLVVATYVGVVTFLSGLRRRRQASASPLTILPTGLTTASRGPIGR